MSPGVESFREVELLIGNIERAIQERDSHAEQRWKSIALDVASIKVKLDVIEAKVEDHYVRKDYFEARLKPLEWVAYGIAGTIGVIVAAVFGSLLWPK